MIVGAINNVVWKIIASYRFDSFSFMYGWVLGQLIGPYIGKRGRSKVAEGGDDKLEAAQDAMEELKEQKIGKNILIFGFVCAVGWYWYSALGTS